MFFLYNLLIRYYKSKVYFIYEQRYYNDLTQSEIAALLGISQVKVSRYEKKGIEKMRTLVKDCA